LPLHQCVLSLSCNDRPGLVARVATHIFEAGGNIVESNQYNDIESTLFFMRIEFGLVTAEAVSTFRDTFATIANEYAMKWKMHRADHVSKVLIFVSKFDHCLADILYRVQISELQMEISGIISNHPQSVFSNPDFGDIPFHHLPINTENKAQQEHRAFEIFEETGSELCVLARYMQIFSDEMAIKLDGRCINIHHSFLPGFKGARPYHQAHERGVKVIGATAHYVTGDLDEGPIIEQDVERISHYDTPDDLVCKGRDIERRVLSKAIAFHLDGRVLLNGRKTVVFPR
jgi:formyltetrahydrofolate deformylase